MSTHRSNQIEIERAINAKGTYSHLNKGAFVIWTAPQSPDTNPIEKFWDVCLNHQSRYASQLRAGIHGPPRRFTYYDLLFCLRETRMTPNSYRCVLRDD